MNQECEEKTFYIVDGKDLEIYLGMENPAILVHCATHEVAWKIARMMRAFVTNIEVQERG